jgi:hypothetical protein
MGRTHQAGVTAIGVSLARRGHPEPPREPSCEAGGEPSLRQPENHGKTGALTDKLASRAAAGQIADQEIEKWFVISDLENGSNGW